MFQKGLLIVARFQTGLCKNAMLTSKHRFNRITDTLIWLQQIDWYDRESRLRDHTVTNTNRDRFRIVGGPSHDFIILAFYDEGAGLETVYWPSSESPFRWRVDEGPILFAFGFSLPSSTKTTSEFETLLQNFLDPRMT